MSILLAKKNGITRNNKFLQVPSMDKVSKGPLSTNGKFDNTKENSATGIGLDL